MGEFDSPCPSVSGTALRKEQIEQVAWCLFGLVKAAFLEGEGAAALVEVASWNEKRTGQ